MDRPQIALGATEYAGEDRIVPSVAICHRHSFPHSMEFHPLSGEAIEAQTSRNAARKNGSIELIERL